MDRFRLMPNYRYYSAEGTSPLCISSPIGKPLRNYRIYGSGGGVGDKSKNLFNIKWIMEQTNAANFFELNDETLILKSYACRTYISPEKFLEYTGLSEGDTIATSLNITLVAGTTTDNYFGRVMFWSKDTAAHPNLILTVNGSSRQLTIPEGFYSTNYSDMLFYGAKNADENGNLEAHITEFMITKDLTATEYEPYGYKVPISIKGKNLFDIDAFLALNDNSAYYSKNENGEIVQVKPDYRTDKTLFNYVTLPMGTYTISCSNTSITKSIVYLNGASTSGSLNRTFTITETSTIGFKFYESAGTVLGHIQIEERETASEYEPYTAPNTYNIYLDEPLAEGEYIDYINGSGLPRIQTNKGTNIITVGTEVKPSNIEAQYYK